MCNMDARITGSYLRNVEKKICKKKRAQERDFLGTMQKFVRIFITWKVNFGTL